MSRMLVVVILLLVLDASGFAEPCNPVIDGTYCATNMGSRPDNSTSGQRFAPIRNIGGDISTGSDQPATLGAITFSGSTRCIGLLRRGNCN